MKTTIDPDLQEAAVSALAGRVGGIAVLDARNGDVRALAGQAFSAPQPPGSTFKMITTTAALQKGVVSLDDEFEITNGVNVGGRFIENANGEYCGGTFREAFAESCNADFAPLGPKIGNDDLVATAERFGFNSPPTLYAPKIVAEVEPAESTIPTEIGEEVDLGVSAIGQGEVLATPLQMASVAQTIANGGVREPTSIVANTKLRPEAKPVRVMSKKIADELTELMVGVVTGGTGNAGAIPEAQVAGKTGTAELGPKPGEEESPRHPEQRKDAWFAAFAPAEKPKLAVGVLLIEAEAAGGEVAAPAAARCFRPGSEVVSGVAGASLRELIARELARLATMWSAAAPRFEHECAASATFPQRRTRHPLEAPQLRVLSEAISARSSQPRPQSLAPQPVAEEPGRLQANVAKRELQSGYCAAQPRSSLR